MEIECTQEFNNSYFDQIAKLAMMDFKSLNEFNDFQKATEDEEIIKFIDRFILVKLIQKYLRKDIEAKYSYHECK